MKDNKLVEKYDDNPGAYFNMLVEGFEDKEESLNEDYITDLVAEILGKKFPMDKRNIKWLSNNGTSGEVEYKGQKFAFRKLPNGDYKVMRSSDAGWNWSETLFKDEALNEADTIAKPFRKDVKGRYKAFDRRRDAIRKSNSEIEQRLASKGIKKGSKDYDLAKKVLFDEEPKLGKSRKVNYDGFSHGLEKNKYPFYVTHYEETPYYHPEEGGYYIAGRIAVDSEGFDNKEDALKFAKEIADELEMRKISDKRYVKDSKYIGEGEHIFVETEKEYLSHEEGDRQYESLKEDKFVPRDKMSKKDRKELDSQKRNTWGNTNPVTRVQPNKKAYDRKRDKKTNLDEAKKGSKVYIAIGLEKGKEPKILGVYDSKEKANEQYKDSKMWVNISEQTVK